MALKLILVATDLSQRSDRAVARAGLLARESGAALHILNVVDDELPAPIAEAEIAAAEASLKDLAAAPGTLHGLDLKVEVLAGDPWKAIVQRADYLDADLIVMGAHRNRGIAGMFEGTTLERVARTARHPVLRVAGPPLDAYRRPLVGLDFSDCSREAARLAHLLAPKAEVTLVHGYHVPYRALSLHTASLGGLTKAEKDAIETDLQRQIDAFVAGLGTVGQPFRSVIREGAPERVLAELRAEQNVDLICLGMHARSWLYNSVLGSTAHDVLADCPCDLLLAPLPKR